MLDNRKKVIANKDMFQLASDVLDGMVDWVRVVDVDGNVVYSNRAMQEGVGESMVGQKCYAIFGKSCPCRRCVTEMTKNTGEISEKEEMIGERFFSMKSAPVKDEDGNIYAVVEVLRDVTRERKLEKQIMLRNEKMSNDINFARKIQRKLLPEAGDYECVKVEYIYLPSEMLSGDMFDIFNIDESHIGFYISDVVGHGVTASIMTMFVKQTLASISNEFASPSEALSYLHKNFLDLNLEAENYFTIFYGVFNTETKELSFVNGGHNSIPMLIRGSEIIKLEGSGYPIMSLFPKVSYTEHKIRLEKDDRLILYTDGLIEAKNKENELYGYERLQSAIENNMEKDSSIISYIKEDVDEFRYKELDDDFTLIQLNIN